MMPGRSSWAAVVGLICAGVAIQRPAAGFNVSSNVVVEGGVLAGDGAGNSIVPTAVGGGYLYDWTGVSTPGLDMGAYLMTNGIGSNLVFNLAGGSILGSNARLITTYRGSGAGLNSGAVTITNVGQIEAGGIDAHSQKVDYYGAQANAGAVTIGSASNPAGPVRLGFIDTHAGNVTGGNGIGGNVSIYSSGDVKIETAGGVTGAVQAWVWSHYAGNVNIQHEGSFCAGDISTFLVSSWSGGTMRSGNVTCNGDAAGNGPSGTFETGGLYSQYDGGGYGSVGGIITIVGYTKVWIKGGIKTYEKSNQAWLPGNVLITNITGDIQIDGDMDLSGYLNAGGNLSLFADGLISVRNLDLNKLNKAAFLSARGKNYILGTLTSFTGADDLRLLAPAGHKIYYDARFNESLAGGIFPLRDLGGLTGGGTLEPIPARGTVVVFR